MPVPLTIVMSVGQSRSPEKRGLEDAIVQAVTQQKDVKVFVIPHLYDLVADGPSIAQLRQIQGPMVVLSWLYERAAHWVLDRLGVQGRLEPTELSELPDEEDDEVQEQPEMAVEAIASRPTRNIHCLDLRVRDKAEEFVDELERLIAWYHEQTNTDSILDVATVADSKPQTLTLANLFFGSNDSLASQSNITPETSNQFASPLEQAIGNLQRVDEHPTRRWYPVIDFSRCTNCMECIDFCLFGVYGVDAGERILVEQPDNCRKGCPACSRVCPANAIMFPQHKTPAIAGAAAGDSSFKIDLSKLFGAPETNEDAIAVAARERDEQLILSGRAAVGLPAKDKSGEVQTRTTAVIRSQWTAEKPEKDGFDQLLDQLDNLDL